MPNTLADEVTQNPFSAFVQIHEWYTGIGVPDDCMENDMKINTGQGSISLVTLIGIWSVSALNALPGLAVSPILGQLSQTFPQASELDLQMLASLPSLMTIPFVIISGKLAEKVSHILLLETGLGLFLLSGILYLVSDSMWQLIAVSALLGVGSGMIVPLSTGLISHYFTGEARVRQFGYSSAITNLTLVLATVVTGYLAEISWRLPFVVYLLPAVSIILSYSLKGDAGAGGQGVSANPPVTAQDNTASPVAGKAGFMTGPLIETMILYGLATYLVIIISFNLPFLMREYHFSSENAGIMISLFFLAIMLPGLAMGPVIRYLGNRTLFAGFAAIAAGLLSILVAPVESFIAPGCILAGLGYGVIQPWVYEKATHMAVPGKITMALALIMAMNYIAILVCPFIINFCGWLLHLENQQFPFAFNLAISVSVSVYAWTRRKSFVFTP